MIFRASEIDDEYMDKYYDRHMSLLNRGGLTLVNKVFFEWGKKLMSIIRGAFDEDTIDRDPKYAFEKSKKFVMNHQGLATEFTFLCLKKFPGQANASRSIYDFLSKAVHARFAIVFHH